MGIINAGWHEDVIISLKMLEINAQIYEDENYQLCTLDAGKLVLNLIDCNTHHTADEFIQLQESFRETDKQVVHLWEDVWRSRKAQVIGRINSIMGKNIRVHGRKTKIISITQPQANQFLNENHLQLSVTARYKYALVIGNKIQAVACFSGLRKMKDKKLGYQSAELIRFANLTGHTVTGGFTKLLQHFIKLHAPDDIMSYADRDWSLGSAYERAGFKLAETTPSLAILVHKATMERSFPHRIEEDEIGEFVPVFNTGNLKYILDL
ncbi:hypothetical protein ACVWYN_001238 [Pedobacter sp. UYP24]